MNRKLAFALVLSAIAIAGCKREAQPAPVAPAAAPAQEVASAVVSEVDHGSPASAAPGFNVKAFAGTYAGILPCADCPGIDTTIAFTPEGGYTMGEIYQDSDSSAFATKGTWTVREDGKTLLLDPEDKEEYDHWYEVVSPTELRMLDREGKPIDSKLDYSLRRK